LGFQQIGHNRIRGPRKPILDEVGSGISTQTRLRCGLLER
jgi:hypothetical protein